MKYEKLFKAYKFFLLCPFKSNLFVNVKLHSGPKEMYRSLLDRFFLQKIRRLFEGGAENHSNTS